MEIGSEYWKYEGDLNCDNSKFWNFGLDNKFTLSGRTSIYYVLKNIIKNQKVNKAYLPSYCCHTMYEPFKELGIEVEFYDVYYNEGLKYNIEIREDIDIFYAMNYFGYSSSNMEKYIKQFKDLGKVVIEDITHSFFSDKKYSEYSDYLIGSLRKWLPIASGGIACNMNANFEIELENKTNEKMINIKNDAMQNKKNYIEKNEKVSKESYLNKYEESNKDLDEDYKNYSIDKRSLEIIMGINLQEVINLRVKNAKTIYKKLKNNENVRFLVEDYNNKDALLFVPIMLENRDNLRKYLIENNIYVPVHWILDEKINGIFDKELSLICDQRYSENQISEYIDLLINYLKV